MLNYIGIDVGGSFIKYGIVDDNGNVYYQGKITTFRENPKKIMEDLIKIITELKQYKSINQVGISLPGVIDRNNRLVTSGALEGLYKVDVAQILSDATNTSVTLTNDAKAIAYGEQWLGAGKNCDNFVCIPLGTGVGGSIVSDGHVLKGNNGVAGEFGMMLMEFGRSEPLIFDSASFHCGVIAGLCRLYNKKKGNKDFTTWEKDVKIILERASSGEMEARESLSEFYHNAAVLLLNIRVTLDPEKILLGGGVSESVQIMDGIKQAVKKLFARYTEISSLGFPTIEPCYLGNKAGMIGAVSVLRRGEK